MTTPSPPPGTGGTLVDELEQAAKRADERAAADEHLVRCVGGTPMWPMHRAEATGLRARAARVRELLEAKRLDLANWMQAGDARVEAIVAAQISFADKLCGHLSPTEPAATPTRDERRWTGRHHWEALPGTGWQCSCGSLRRVYGTTEQTNSFEYRTPPARNWTSQEPPCGAGRAATPTEKGGAR